MSNSPDIIKSAADFTRAQSEGLGFHLNSKNEVKTHGKFIAVLYRIRDLFRSQNTINEEKTKLSEALQKILSSHSNSMTADPGADPNLNPAELANLKHNIKLAADSAVNFNKPGVDVKKLESAVYARLGTALSPKELDVVKKEILRYGNSQLEAMHSLELKLQKQAADKNESYLMSSRQIEDYEGLVSSYLACIASGSESSEIKMLPSLSKFNIIDNFLQNHPGCEFSRDQKLAMISHVDSLAADKLAELNRTDPQHAKKYLSDEEYNELCTDYFNSIIKNERPEAEVGVSSDSPAKNVVPTDAKQRRAVIEAEIIRIANLYDMKVPENLDAAIKEIEAVCIEGTTTEELAMRVDEFVTSGLLQKSVSERSNEVNSKTVPADETQRRSLIKAEIIRIAKLYDVKVPDNLDPAVKNIENICTADTTKDDLGMYIDQLITSGSLNEIDSQAGRRGLALQVKEVPDCRMPVSNGNPITQGQLFRQQAGSNTCFILSIFNGLCNSAQGTRWLNEHVTQDLVQKGTLHFHPRDTQNRESDIEINIHSSAVQQVRYQVLSRKGSDCMSDFEAACARAYMDYFDQGYDMAFRDAMKSAFGSFSTLTDQAYRPGQYGEAIVMANILGLYADARSSIPSSSLRANRQAIITLVQDFLRNNKGIVLFHKNSSHFTAVQDVSDNGDFTELDSLDTSVTKQLKFDTVAASPINLVFISFTKENQFNAGAA